MAKRIHWHNDSFKKKANEISIDPINGIESPNVQGTLEELAARESGGGIKYFEYDVKNDGSEDDYDNLFPLEPGQVTKAKIPIEFRPSDLTSVSNIISVSVMSNVQNKERLFVRAVDGHPTGTIDVNMVNVGDETLSGGTGGNRYLRFRIYYI